MLNPYNNYQEYLRHPEFLVIKTQKLKEVGFMCEICNRVKTSVVHHLCYPKWGTFDSVDNLMAVCHQCHCLIHLKED